MPQKPPARRRRAYVSIAGTTQMHLRSPIVVALWSAIFPGLGHLLLSKYIPGFLLFAWEVLINVKSHLNQAIFYSFTGQAELAKGILDKQWFLLYFCTYLFAIWDSYRTTADMNNNFVLAAREDAPVTSFIVHALGFNYLDKSSPAVAMIWSALAPGAGQLIFHRLMVAFFLFLMWIIVVFQSKLLPAIHYTMLGQFEQTKDVLNQQWFLNLPSLFFFSIYDAHVNTVESNKLFDWEQAKFLRREYQNRLFPMPIQSKGNGGDRMYIISNFEHTIKLETAITAVEMKGIPKEHILAVPMDKKNAGGMLFDQVHSSDGLSMLDIPMILAALFALFGAIYGFLLNWGPVIWGLIGTGLGAGVGILIKLYTTRKNKKKQRAQTAAVFLLIACEENQAQMVQDTLWAYSALGVSKLQLDGQP
ncbi:MAG: hypothetical protein AAGU74_06790 [Bacillota bacterium]